MIAIISKNNEIKTKLDGTGQEILEDLVKGCVSIILKLCEDDEELYEVITNDFIENLRDFSAKVKENNFTDTDLKM